MFDSIDIPINIFIKFITSNDLLLLILDCSELDCFLKQSLNILLSAFRQSLFLEFQRHYQQLCFRIFHCNVINEAKDSTDNPISYGVPPYRCATSEKPLGKGGSRAVCRLREILADSSRFPQESAGRPTRVDRAWLLRAILRE